MTQGPATPVFPLYRGAIVAGMALLTSACGGTGNLWQGEEVLVEARQVTLERSVDNVSENNRELKDRFNALERLYVDLVRHMRTQGEQLDAIQKSVSNFKKDPATQTALRRVSNDLKAVRKDMKGLENRVFNVEVAERNTVVPTKKQDTAPTGTSQDGADAQAPAAVATASSQSTPVSSQPEAVAPSRTFYGVHLASYRSKEQVNTGWSALFRAFSSQLDGLTPLIYTQSQDGIGTFLRLIVGPLEEQEQAAELCARIKQNGAEQYCKVSEYQGDPVVSPGK